MQESRKLSFSNNEISKSINSSNLLNNQMNQKVQKSIVSFLKFHKIDAWFSIPLSVPASSPFGNQLLVTANYQFLIQKSITAIRFEQSLHLMNGVPN